MFKSPATASKGPRQDTPRLLQDSGSDRHETSSDGDGTFGTLFRTFGAAARGCPRWPIQCCIRRPRTASPTRTHCLCWLHRKLCTEPVPAPVPVHLTKRDYSEYLVAYVLLRLDTVLELAVAHGLRPCHIKMLRSRTYRAADSVNPDWRRKLRAPGIHRILGFRSATRCRAACRRS